MKAKAGLLALIGMLLWSGPLAAQAVTYQVFFGDSLTDSGNSYPFTGVPPVFGGPASSDGGRFSNGPMWVDYRSGNIGFYVTLLLGGNLPAGTDAINFAVGGSNSGTEPLGPGGPGALTQINDYLNFAKAGKAPAVTPTTLYSIFTGGNDYTGYIGALGPTGTATAASEQALVSTVIGNVGTALTTLANAGAKQFIVFDQFDLGLVPLLNNPAQFGAAGSLPANAGQLGTQLTDLNNAQIGAALQQARAKTGASVIEIDVNALYRDEYNHPSAWGLTNVTGTCVGLDFVTQTGLCQTPQQAAQLMFWQATHPSGTTHANLAALVAGTLQTVYTAPGAIAVQSQLALQAAQAGNAVVGDRLADLVRQRVAAIAAISYDDRTRSVDTGRSGYSANTTLGTAGISLRVAPPVVIGATVSYGKTSSSLAGSLGSVKLDSEGFAGFVGYHRDGWTALVQAGGTNDDFDRIQRNAGFTPYPWATASTSGWTWSAGGEIRYAVPAGNWTISPLAGVRYDHVAIDAYQESGTRLLDLAVNSHEVGAVTATTGLRADGQYALRTVTLLPRLSVLYHHQFGNDDEAIVAQLSDGQPVDGQPGAGSRDDVLLRGEMGIAWTPTVRTALAYQHSIIRDDGSDSRVDLSLMVSF